MSAAMTSSAPDYAVADIKLADWGRKEIAIAETEMPGLMATRAEYGAAQPLKGARIAGSLHMTIQTAVLIETLKALGADVRWASCNIYSTQDHAAAAIAAAGTPVFAIKGESLTDYWDYTHRIFEWADGGTPNMILDDGGDATLLIHLGIRAEGGDTAFLDGATNEEEEVLFAAIKARLEVQPRLVRPHRQGHQGRDRGDHDGRPPPLHHGEGRQAAVPGHQRQRLRHQVEVRQPLRLPRIAGRRHPPRHRRHDGRQGRHDRGLRRRRQGLGRLAAQRRLPRHGVRGRSDLRAAGRDGRLRGHHDGGRGARAPTSSCTATGNVDVITLDHMRAMKDRAIVCNIGHFDSEIQVAALKNFKWHNVKPQVDEIEFADGKRIILLSEGRLVNLGNATGHPSFVMSASFTNQTLAQIELWTKQGQYEKKVYMLPKTLDEKVAALHLDKIGVKLTKLTDQQATYLGLPQKGPFKPENYRY